MAMESKSSLQVPGSIMLQKPQQGLGSLQPKCSGINMLTDPRILQHLTNLHKDAKDSDVRPQSPEGDVVEELRGQLKRNIAAYNMRNQLGKFSVVHTEVNHIILL